MANISSLAVQMTAKVGGFVQGMNQAGNSVDRFSKRAANSLQKQRSAALLGEMTRRSGVGDSFEMLAARAQWAAQDAEKRRLATTQQTVAKLKEAQLAQKGWTHSIVQWARVGTSSAKQVLVGFASILKRMALVSGLSLAGFIYGIRRAADDIDDLAKASDRLGFSTQGLGAIRFAGLFSGVEAATVDTGLQRMLNAVSESASGVGEAVKTFQALGISAQQLKRMSPEQQFVAIRNALDNVGNSADRVRFAMDIFGRGGARMLNIDVAGVQQAAQEMRNLGLEVSRFDAAKVEEANDAFELVKQAVKGLFTQLAIQLAPAVTDLSRRFTDWAQSGGGMTVKVAEGLDMLWNGVQQVGKGFTVFFHLLKAGFWGVGYVIHRGIIEALNLAIVVTNRFLSGLRLIPGLGDMIPKFELPIEDMRKSVDELKKNADREAGGAIEALMTPPDKMQYAKRLSDWWKNVQQQANLNAANAVSNPMESLIDDEASDAMRKQAESLVKATRTPLEQFREKISEIQKLFNAGLIDQTTYNRAIGQAADDFMKAGGNASDMRREVESLNKVLNTGNALSGTAGTIATNRADTAITNRPEVGNIMSANRNNTQLQYASMIQVLQQIAFNTGNRSVELTA